MMPRAARLASALLSFACFSACASVAPTPSADAVAACPASPCCGVVRIEVEAVPEFNGDGTVLRDETTGAPVYRCRSARRTDPLSVPASEPCPRWNADGTVARDAATGAPVFEERAEGKVVRVLIVLPY